jgi:hypothetical protein
MMTRSYKWAFVALFAVTLTASGVLGCDEGNGGAGTADVIGTDIGPDSTPSDAATSDIGPADPCAQYAKYESKVWTCCMDNECHDCTTKFWIEEDDQSVEHCTFDCSTALRGFYTDDSYLEWSVDSFTLIGPPDLVCNLKEVKE